MEEQGETRKVQFTGKSTYTVSLPKQWINELGLKQGESNKDNQKRIIYFRIVSPKI